jgi:hypothetical protein
MADWDTVSRVARALPDVVEGTGKEGHRYWQIGEQTFAWERPLRKSDLAALGDDAPKGAILAVHVPDLETKDALVTQRPAIYFTTPHFRGYPAVLVRLGKIRERELRTLLVEGLEARRAKKVRKRRPASSSRARRST